MKTYILSALFAMMAFTANAMSFSRAQEEALYLTDKMAYELNLNDAQYNDVYEINLDYFLNVSNYNDISGAYYSHRLYDLRCIMHDWQYNLLTAADYFLRPIVWRAGGFFFPIYSHYTRGHFFFDHPSVYISYRGGHGHYYHDHGFYVDRRPAWNGGMRGNMRYVHSGRRDIGGHGYHFSVPSRGGQRGGSFNGGQRGGSYSGGQRGGSFEGGQRGGSFNGGQRGGSYEGGQRGGSFNGGQRQGSHGDSFGTSSSRISGSQRGNSTQHSGSSSFSGGQRSNGGSSFNGGQRGGGQQGGRSHGGRR